MQLVSGCNTMKGGSAGSVILLLLALTVLSVYSQQGTLNNQFQDLQAAMVAEVGNEDPSFFSITPSTPIPENINCYVEIPSARVGGMCVRLGRRRQRRRRGRNNRSNRVSRNSVTWGCQAGVHLDLWNEDCFRNNRRIPRS